MGAQQLPVYQECAIGLNGKIQPAPKLQLMAFLVFCKGLGDLCCNIVVALDEGLNNLKVLGFDKKKKAYFLRSCNEDKERYADIYPKELQIQGVAVCVTHKLGKINV